MKYYVLTNFHLVCLACGTERNEPFCPVCEVPHFQDGAAFVPRYDGIDGLRRVDSERAANHPSDLFDLFDAPTF